MTKTFEVERGVHILTINDNADEICMEIDVPEGGEHEFAPKGVKLIAAIAARLKNDPEFCKEMLEWMDNALAFADPEGCGFKNTTN